MKEHTIYYILGTLAFVYLLITIMNRRKAKGRKDRKFMSNYKRKDTKK